jgi:hypothetical protein
MTVGAIEPTPHRSVWSTVSTLVTLAGNLIPLFGVLFWRWDTFQLLMLYWTETVILAFWTMRRLARLAPQDCGTFTVAGVAEPATPATLVRFFRSHAALFIVVHLALLWAFFSADWLKKVHGAGSFFFELFLANGVWVGLVIFAIGAWIAFVADGKPKHQGVAGRETDRSAAQPDGERSTAVGAIVGTLYLRVFIMQAAVILGAWVAQAAGSTAPLLIVIVLKTLADLGRIDGAALVRGSRFSDGRSSYQA